MNHKKLSTCYSEDSGLFPFAAIAQFVILDPKDKKGENFLIEVQLNTFQRSKRMLKKLMQWLADAQSS